MTSSSSRSALLLGFAALLAACGSRSQLRDAGATSAGGGGSGPTTSSASSSGGGGSEGVGGHGDAGGSGGMLGGCIVDGQPIGLAGTDGYVTSNPVFVVPVQVDGTTLVSAWQATEGPIVTPIELRHTSFQPWGLWPANGTLGPSYLAEYDGGQTFYAAPSFTDFSVVFTAVPPGIGLTTLSHLVPGSGALGVTKPAGNGGGGEEPCFLERGADPHIHLLGYSESKAAPHVFNITRMDDTSPAWIDNANLGCALDPIVAGAAPFGEDFFLAFSSGSFFKDPACSTNTGIGAASRLQIARVSKTGQVDLIQELKYAGDGSPLAAVKVIPRLDGAWVAWTVVSSSILHVARLDASGKVADGPVIVPFTGNPDSLSATSLGDSLALAWSATAADTGSQIVVNVLSTVENLDAYLSIKLGPPATGRTALLGSPSSKGLLIAWSEEVPSGRQIRVARLACSLP